MQTTKGRGRGFASMSSDKKREIASKGGKAAHAMGTAHTWTRKASSGSRAQGRRDQSSASKANRSSLNGSSVLRGESLSGQDPHYESAVRSAPL